MKGMGLLSKHFGAHGAVIFTRPSAVARLFNESHPDLKDNMYGVSPFRSEWKYDKNIHQFVEDGPSSGRVRHRVLRVLTVYGSGCSYELLRSTEAFHARSPTLHSDYTSCIEARQRVLVDFAEYLESGLRKSLQRSSSGKKPIVSVQLRPSGALEVLALFVE